MRGHRRYQRKVQQLPLLDAPSSWLSQFISGEYLGDDSKLSLFQTCRQLNEMVMQHSQFVCIGLQLLDRPVGTALRTLQLANKHAPSVELELRHHWDGRRKGWWHPVHRDRLHKMGHAVCSFLQEAAQQGATGAVTSVLVEKASFDTVLPPVISQACPNLTSLHLHKCCINHDNAVNSSQCFQQLRHLKLSRVRFTSNTLKSSQSVKDLQSQLKGLPALQHFSLINAQADVGDLWPLECGVVGSVVSKLTDLTWDPSSLVMDAEYFKSVPWLESGAAIHHLVLPKLVVDSDAMEILLLMPSLRQVTVGGFDLEQSFVGRACQWEELTSTSVHFTALAQLPLHSDMVFTVYDEGLGAVFSIDDITSDGVVQEAITNVQKCKRLEWGEDTVYITSDCSDEEAFADTFAELLARVVPLLGTVNDLRITVGNPGYGVCLTSSAMATLRDFVRNKQDNLNISLGPDCVWEAEHVTMLMAAMPRNSQLTLVLQGKDMRAKLKRPCEQLMTQLCCAAQHELSLHIECVAPLQSGYMKRIHAAMRACGHEHVKVTVNVQRDGSSANESEDLD